MDKNKRIGLVVLLVLGIVLCTWSIYNSIVTISKSDNSTNTEQASNNSLSQEKNNSGNPVIIDDTKSGSNTDNNTEPSNDEDTTSETSSNVGSTTNYNEKYITYTVEENETLKDICERYSDNCPVSLLSKAILLSNNLKSSKDIKEGMTIKIPEKYTLSGLKYTVKSGDSISSIVTKYMNDLDYAEAIEILKRDNYLTSDNIRVGEVLFVSVSDLSLVTADKDEEEVDEDVEGESSNTDIDNESATPTLSLFTNRIGEVSSYTVKKNDTLASISKKYSESCPQKSAANIILKLNNLSKSSDIKEGIEIKLPDKYLSEGTTYTVKVGDTLSSIASENLEDVDWYTAVSIISQDNDIKNDIIFAGQELFIASISN